MKIPYLLNIFTSPKVGTYNYNGFASIKVNIPYKNLTIFATIILIESETYKIVKGF